jgi:hypothetical protein
MESDKIDIGVDGNIPANSSVYIWGMFYDQ